jgi:hypothetical protein
MGKDHMVQGGEDLGSIAEFSGFRDYRTIWNDPNNAELRQRRRNPNRLFPGDEVFIPAQQQPQQLAETGQQHLITAPQTSLQAPNPDGIPEQNIGSHVLPAPWHGQAMAQQPIAKPPGPSTDTTAQPTVSASVAGSIKKHTDVGTNDSAVSSATTAPMLRQISGETAFVIPTK